MSEIAKAKKREAKAAGKQQAKNQPSSYERYGDSEADSAFSPSNRRLRKSTARERIGIGRSTQS
jgi:hypothetical protein